MEITYFDNPYAVPDARYVCVFVGVEPYTNLTARGRDGNPLPAGLKWKFTIAHGPEINKPLSKVTAAQPTAKNSCGKMIMYLTGSNVGDGMTINIDKLIGSCYRVSVKEGKVVDMPPITYLCRHAGLEAFLKAEDASASAPPDAAAFDRAPIKPF